MADQTMHCCGYEYQMNCCGYEYQMNHINSPSAKNYNLQLVFDALGNTVSFAAFYGAICESIDPAIDDFAHNFEEQCVTGDQVHDRDLCDFQAFENTKVEHGKISREICQAVVDFIEAVIKHRQAQLIAFESKYGNPFIPFPDSVVEYHINKFKRIVSERFCALSDEYYDYNAEWASHFLNVDDDDDDNANYGNVGKNVRRFAYEGTFWCGRTIRKAEKTFQRSHRSRTKNASRQWGADEKRLASVLQL